MACILGIGIALLSAKDDRVVLLILGTVWAPGTKLETRMRVDPKRSDVRRGRTSGFSVLEIVIVVFIIMVVAAIAVPNVLLAVANVRLRSSAGDLAGLMQQARILAARTNPQNPPVYAIRYGTRSGRQIAYVDINNDSSWTSSVTVNGVTFSEPLIEFSGTVVPAAGAPSGSGGQPGPYILAGDTVIGGSSFDNTHTMAYTPRGFPCDYSSPPTCTTPAATYFVYYLTDTRVGGAGWAGVVVTKAGRTKVVFWNGSSWN
jgi:type II secretory pathway pseudopilin PulG